MLNSVLQPEDDSLQEDDLIILNCTTQSYPWPEYHISFRRGATRLVFIHGRRFGILIHRKALEEILLRLSIKHASSSNSVLRT